MAVCLFFDHLLLWSIHITLDDPLCCTTLHKRQLAIFYLVHTVCEVISVLYTNYIWHLSPQSQAATAELKVANELRTKTADGKATFLTPDAGQISRVIGNGQALVDALRKFQAFAAEHSGKFPTLTSLPMTKEDIDLLQQKLDAIKNMPF